MPLSLKRPAWALMKPKQETITMILKPIPDSILQSTKERDLQLKTLRDRNDTYYLCGVERDPRNQRQYLIYKLQTVGLNPDRDW